MKPRIHLAALGDVALISQEAMGALSEAEDFISSLGADVVVANLETPIGKGDPALEKINLCASEEAISCIHNAGINIVNLANNHIMDYGEAAVSRTITLLKETGIHYFGIGTLNDMANPIVLDVNGLKLAFMGYAAPTTHPILAANDTMGSDKLEVEKIVNDIQVVKRDVNYVVVSLHWGLQDQFYPTPKQIAQAHAIIDAGAHVIIGHHAHVFQGVEYYRKGIIFYGLGNFIFPDFESDSHFDENGDHCTYCGKWYSWNQYSLVPMLDFGGGSATVREIIIAKFDSKGCHLEVLEGRGKIRMLKRLRAISRPISQPYYSAYWKAQKRVNNLHLLWARWKENGFKPALKTAHFKALITQVVKGKLAELDDGNEE